MTVSRSLPVATLSMLVLLSGCATSGLRIGPADLDTSSPAAPVCEPQTYPPRAAIKGDRGLAVVRARVAADGQVATTELVASTMDDDLDAASLRAVRGCRFAPAATGNAPLSDALRPVDVTVVWELVARPGDAPADRGVVRIGVRPAGAVRP